MKPSPLCRPAVSGAKVDQVRGGGESILGFGAGAGVEKKLGYGNYLGDSPARLLRPEFRLAADGRMMSPNSRDQAVVVSDVVDDCGTAMRDFVYGSFSVVTTEEMFGASALAAETVRPSELNLEPVVSDAP